MATRSVPELLEAAASRDPATITPAYMSLMRLVMTEPHSYLHSIFAFFCENLNPKFIPTSLYGQLPLTALHPDCERALHAMKGFALTGTLYHEDNRILDGLCQIWNSIWSWVRYFHTSCIDEDRLPVQKRGPVLTVVSGIYKLYSSHDRLRVISESTPGYLEMITQQWALQIRIHEFSSNPAAYPPAAALSAYTQPSGSVQPMATTRVIVALGGYADDVARLALDHLNITAEQARAQPSLAISAGGDIDLMTNFRTSSAVQSALLARHSVRAVTSFLYSLSLAPFSNDIRESVAFGLTSCSHYLSYALEAADATPSIIEALEAQLLPAMLRSGVWLAHMNPVLVKAFLIPLTEVIPKYLVYLSVLKGVVRTLRRIRMMGIESKVQQQGLLWDAWIKFKSLVDDRCRIQHQLPDSQDKYQTCHSNTCRKPDINDTYVPCDNCHEVWFCSDSCHTASTPMHMPLCRQIQARRREGRIAMASSRDIFFSDIVAQVELQRRLAEIGSHFGNQRPKVPVVELDFSTFPVKMSLGNSVTLRPFDYATNPDERTTWNGVVTRAEKENNAILRYYLPAGQFRTIGIHLFPLPRW